jgi:hypothetical protein
MTNYPNQIDGYSTLPVLVDLVSPVRAADVNRLRNSIIAIERELGINPSGTYGTVRARLNALELGLGGSIIMGGGGSAGTGADYLSGMIETPTDKEYFLTTEIPYDGYIYSISTKSSTGSCTLTTKINGIAVGGTPNAVSTTEVTEYTSAPNEFFVGDTLTVEVSGNASCADLSFTVLMYVTPGGEFGEANVGANVGVAGVGPYKQKTGLTLEFRNINAGSNKISVGLDAPNNEIDIDVVEANLTLNNIGGSPLSISNGGTGQSIALNGFNALAPTTTKGDLIVRNNTSNVRLGVGTDGYFLIADSTQPEGVRWGSAAFVGANTALSNLSATAINLSLIPGADDVLDLGSSSLRWRDLYLGPTSLRFVTTITETGTVRNWRLRVRETVGSTRGSFIIQEGASEYLYITPVGNVGIGVTDPSTIIDINGVSTYRGVGSPPSVSLTGQGTIYFDGATNKFRFSENGGAYQDFGTGGGGGGANTSLSNLVATNINTSLLPATDDGYDLGGSAQRWRDLYLGPTSLHLVSTSGETGTARDWKLAIAEAAGSTRGRLRVMEGASEYINITPSGLIGIGTTEPTLDLHVLKASSVTIQSENSATTGYASVISRNNSGSYVQLFSAGSAQTGTWFANDTSPLSRANTVGFRTGGSETALVFAAQGNVPLQIGQNDTTRLLFNSTLGVINPSNKDYDLQIRGQTTSDLIYVDASANKVGIGTNAPGSTVPGNVVLDVVTATDTKIVARTTGGIGTGFASFTLQSTGASNNPYFEWQLIPSNTDRQSYIRHNYVGLTTTNEILVLRGDGHVGIGTTNPNEALTLQGVLSLQEQAVGPAISAGYGKIFVGSDSKLYFIDDSGTQFDLTAAGVSGTGAADSVTYWSSPSALTNSATFVWKESTQRVGIGTTDPTASAHVFSSTDAKVKIEAGASNKAGVDFNTGGTIRADIIIDGSVSGTPLSINKNYATDVTIAAGGGNVGFGNITPSSKIDVDGSITWRGLTAPPVAPAGQGRIYFDTSTSKLKISESGGAYFDISAGIAADINLSNLTATAINTDLLPQVDDGYDLGSELFRWRDGYFGPSSLHIITKVGETTDPHHWVLGAAEAPGPTQGRFTIRDGNSEFFSVDGYGFVGIGTSEASSILEVGGAITYGGMTPPPVAPSGKGRIYFDSVSNQFRMSENGAPYVILGSGGANTSLSNISSTNISDSLIPAVNDGYDLGSDSRRWRDGYFGAETLHIGNSIADEARISYDGTADKLYMGIGDGQHITVKSDGYVGVGTNAPTSKLSVNGSFAAQLSTKTANYTATSADHTLLGDASSGNITITLPAASTCTNRFYIIKKIDITSNTVTIDGNASELIDGATTYVLSTQYESVTLQCDGTNWWIV